MANLNHLGTWQQAQWDRLEASHLAMAYPVYLAVAYLQAHLIFNRENLLFWRHIHTHRTKYRRMLV